MIFDLLMKFKIIKFDWFFENEGSPDEPAIVTLSPRWFWQKRKEEL